jgi:hypothetical protein
MPGRKSAAIGAKSFLFGYSDNADAGCIESFKKLYKMLAMIYKMNLRIPDPSLFFLNVPA